MEILKFRFLHIGNTVFSFEATLSLRGIRKQCLFVVRLCEIDKYTVSQYVGFLGVFAKLISRSIIKLVITVRTSAWNKSTQTGRLFENFHIGNFY